MSAKPCSIRLLNKTYDIKCPEEETDNLHAAAKKLEDALLDVKRKFNLLDDHQSLLLAALHISRELIVCQTQQVLQKQQMTQFIHSLENRINQTVASPILKIDS